MTNEVERLREFLSYDPDTGEFRWKKLGRAWRGIKVGQLAGGPDDKGYLKFRTCRRSLVAASCPSTRLSRPTTPVPPFSREGRAGDDR